MTDVEKLAREYQKLLSEVGGVPEHQVKFIWECALNAAQAAESVPVEERDMEKARDIIAWQVIHDSGKLAIVMVSNIAQALAQARVEEREACIAELRHQYDGCQSGTLVSYHIAAEVLRVGRELSDRARASGAKDGGA